jgi:hypothetical protein
LLCSAAGRGFDRDLEKRAAGTSLLLSIASRPALDAALLALAETVQVIEIVERSVQDGGGDERRAQERGRGRERSLLQPPTERGGGRRVVRV